MIPIPIISLAIAAAVSALAAWTVQGWRMDAERGAMASRAAKDLANLVERQDSAATVYEVFKERERVVFKNITKAVDRIVEREVYRNTCFDADGVGLLNAAIHGQHPADTGIASDKVP